MTAMNILLLNLTRFGDLLQSQAAITDLARNGHRVGVVCLENFAGVAGLLDNVHHLSALPASGLLSALDGKALSSGNGGGAAGQPATLLEGRGETPGSGTAKTVSAPGWAEALAGLLAWKRALEQDFPVDMVCNLTPTLSARMLARLLAGDKPCTGFAVDGHGFGYSSNGWAAFLQGASASRGVSPFNIVDLFRKLAWQERGAVPQSPASLSHASAGADWKPGAAMPPGQASLRSPEKERQEGMLRLMQAEGPENFAGFVALQLGASSDVRRWPVEYFVELGERLWREKRLCPVLLGSPQERHLAARYAGAAGHPFVNLCGRTSLEDLSAALCSIRLLVTNDTGTMHLAAGNSVPVLAVFLATAQPFDTGPYLAGSCSVEPDLACHPCPFGTDCPREHACRRAITAECMAELAFSFLDGGSWRMPQACSGGAAGSVDGKAAERTGKNTSGSAGGKTGEYTAGRGARVWVSAHGRGGFMNLASLSGHDGDDRTLWLQLLRSVISQFIDRNRYGDFVLDMADSEYAFSFAEKERLLADLSTAEIRILALVKQGGVLLEHPLPPLKEKFMRSWQQVHAAFNQSHRLAALSVLWLEETQAEGQELPEILTVMEQFAQLLSGLKNIINK